MNQLYIYNKLIYISNQCKLEQGKEWFQSLQYSIGKWLFRRPRVTLYAIIALITVVITCIFMLHAGPVLNAQSQHETTKYFTTIEVKAGDTLWDIAQEYKTVGYSSTEAYLDEIRSINHIVGDEITSGCYLTIPYYAETPGIGF
ncbi:MAG: LysM peptidoglycan-binding domain-containing protein [Lachnospiraceae bacterium]|nr:LysM peptidoglycan-binding domain-containing protein [Lachnospiraceae bacterium]